MAFAWETARAHVKIIVQNNSMKRIKEIAYELSRGNIEKAAEIRLSVEFDDKSLELEIVEIARQAIFSYFKQGDTEKALDTKKLFNVPAESADEALKQAVLSSYCEGDLKSMIKIRREVPMSKSLRQEIVGYCESWGDHYKEAEAMKKVFLG